MNSVDTHLLQNLSFLQIALGAILIIVAVTTSRFLKLDLEKDFLVASFRTIIQLLAVGFTLRWVLGSDSLLLCLTVLLAMSLAAAQAVISRLKKKSLKLFLTIQTAIIIGAWPLGLISMGILFPSGAHLKAAFFIPFMGVLLGNALSAISLTLLGLQRIQSENLLEIETFIALGASSQEACQRLYRDLLKQALTPIINGMTIVGIVSLPGVMAGQILGGVDPLLSAQTQILLMLIVLVTSLAGSLTALALFHYFLMPKWMHQEKQTWSFQLPEVKRLALSGPSGAGKSRLLKSLVGLDDEYIRQTILSDSKIILRKNPPEFVIYLHQKPYFTPGTVKEALKYSFQFKKHADRNFEEHTAIEFIRSVGLSSEILNQSVTNLSGGEAQLIHLIRALLLQPQIMYLDEPTSALDTHRAALAENLLATWLAEKDNHLILTSHSFEQIQRFCTKTVYLENGKLAPLA